MRTTALTIAWLVMTACHEPTKQDDYHEAARRLNPFLLALQPTKARVHQLPPNRDVNRFYDEHPAAVNEAVDAFMDARELLAELGKVDAHESRVLRRLWITNSASALADSWNRPDGASEHAHFVFWWHSQGVWDHLAEEVEELRYCAAQEGVEILSLGGTRRPDNRCP